MIARVQQGHPKASWFAITLREVVSANQHLWGGLIYAEGQFHVAEPREIGVLDRIGGGDGFVGGMLSGILRGWSRSAACSSAGPAAPWQPPSSPTTQSRQTRTRSELGPDAVRR